MSLPTTASTRAQASAASPAWPPTEPASLSRGAALTSAPSRSANGHSIRAVSGGAQSGSTPDSGVRGGSSGIRAPRPTGRRATSSAWYTPVPGAPPRGTSVGIAPKIQLAADPLSSLPTSRSGQLSPLGRRSCTRAPGVARALMATLSPGRNQYAPRGSRLATSIVATAASGGTDGAGSRTV